jgi:replicative DNA helicase
MGKSAVALQLALNAARKAYGVGYVSLEMKEPALLRRAVVQIAQVDAMRMRLGYLNGEERRNVVDACSLVESLPLHIDDKQASGRTAQAIVASIRQLIARTGIQLAIVDHMHLIDGPEREERSKFNRIIDCLQRGARDLGVPFVVLSQLSRKCEDERREPGLADLRETGKIEDNADLVMFIHRPEMYAHNRDKAELRGLAKLIIAKQRDGATGCSEMLYFKEQTRFVEASERSDSEAVQ